VILRGEGLGILRGGGAEEQLEYLGRWKLYSALSLLSLPFTQSSLAC